jgi:peptidoglycan-associated lipoprotein
VTITARRALLLVATCLVLAVLGCRKKPVETPPLEPEPTPPPTTAPAPTPKPTEVQEPFREEKPTAPEELTADQIKARGLLQTIYFDLDKHDLSDTARSTLRTNAEWLKAHANWKVVVEGHCDERGTTEYNLELGSRRSRAVRDYLISLGIPESRFRTVSYGEERPASQGHDEAAWSKNRRAEFSVE